MPSAGKPSSLQGIPVEQLDSRIKTKNKVTALTCSRGEGTLARWVKDPLDPWSSAVAGSWGF